MAEYGVKLTKNKQVAQPIWSLSQVFSTSGGPIVFPFPCKQVLVQLGLPLSDIHATALWQLLASKSVSQTGIV